MNSAGKFTKIMISARKFTQIIFFVRRSVKSMIFLNFHALLGMLRGVCKGLLLEEALLRALAVYTRGRCVDIHPAGPLCLHKALFM